ncbi:hypothetical protein L226DRAFT_616237 [Lentinus tigrinus ALCF2SS1-7]|uniref:uncharacterized protein n=1 Tax=Lentinus tigrinus ALCF2SS1-7 TaxID=1328758 RepID=UPI0011662C06|nr:hypothetical protein L226DRAFT_616237 [Lentinus tigrinus ALCF2SS1-7]
MPAVRNFALYAAGSVFLNALLQMTVSALVISIQHIKLGFAFPSESYLIPYFDNVDAYSDIGPPVYFVVHDVDVTHRLGQQELCGRFTTCAPFSIASSLELERGRPEVSFISQPTASWIDDCFNWLDPEPSTFCGSPRGAATSATKTTTRPGTSLWRACPRATSS